MRTFPFGPKAHSPFAAGRRPGVSPTGHGFTSSPAAGALQGSGRAKAVIAASASKRAAADLDDWSGGFDFHLGVYTND